jgi:hypothetical protein
MISGIAQLRLMAPRSPWRFGFTARSAQAQDLVSGAFESLGRPGY